MTDIHYLFPGFEHIRKRGVSLAKTDCVRWKGGLKMIRRFNRIVNSSRPVLVDFYADWCVPCRLMPPILKEVKDEFRKHVRIIKVNVDHYPDIASSCKVQNIPSVVLFQDGKIHWSGVGVQQVNDISFALRDIL